MELHHQKLVDKKNRRLRREDISPLFWIAIIAVLVFAVRKSSVML